MSAQGPISVRNWLLLSLIPFVAIYLTFKIGRLRRFLVWLVVAHAISTVISIGVGFWLALDAPSPWSSVFGAGVMVAMAILPYVKLYKYFREWNAQFAGSTAPRAQ